MRQFKCMECGYRCAANDPTAATAHSRNMDHRVVLVVPLEESDYFNPDKLDLNDLARKIHQTAVEHGWWEKDRNVGETIMLMVTELAEAYEEYRDPSLLAAYFKFLEQKITLQQFEELRDHPDNDSTEVEKLWKPEGMAIELADAIIRILDFSHQQGWDMQKLVLAKMAYNDTRPYRHGGKRA